MRAALIVAVAVVSLTLIGCGRYTLQPTNLNYPTVWRLDTLTGTLELCWADTRSGNEPGTVYCGGQKE